MTSILEEFTQSSMWIGVKGFENPSVTSVGFLRYSCMPPIVKPEPSQDPPAPTGEDGPQEVPKDPNNQPNTTSPEVPQNNTRSSEVPQNNTTSPVGPQNNTTSPEVPQNNTTSPVGPPTDPSGEPETKPLFVNLN